MQLFYQRLICLLLLLTPGVLAQEPTALPPKTPEPKPVTPQPAAPRISTPDEIKAEFATVPCKNSERLNTVKALFEKLGAKPEEITVEKFKNVENVLLIKPGVDATAGKVVVGAHYDKTPEGCGALDNWTGIVALAHTYRTLKDLPFKKTIIFVAFGREEEGLIGSSAMVDGLKPEELAKYCAMINVDSLGLSIPQALDHISTKKLVELSATVANEMKVPFSHTRLDAASSDSASFLRRKIPAITITALSNDWPRLLHTGFDQSKKVNHESVYLGYRFVAALLLRVVQSDCQAFREEK